MVNEPSLKTVPGLEKITTLIALGFYGFLVFVTLGVCHSVPALAVGGETGTPSSAKAACELDLDPEITARDVALLNALIAAGITRGSQLKTISAEDLRPTLQAVLSDVPKGSVILSRLTRRYGGWMGPRFS